MFLDPVALWWHVAGMPLRQSFQPFQTRMIFAPELGSVVASTLPGIRHRTYILCCLYRSCGQVLGSVEDTQTGEILEVDADTLYAPAA